jgi:hypothetical protein
VLPPRHERARAILAVMPAVVDDGFGVVLASLVDATFCSSIVARARCAAPGLIGTPFFERKLRAGFSVYAALGISAVACSSMRPTWIAAGSSLVGALRLSSLTIARMARWSMPPAYRVFSAHALDRIAVASAFILVLDEIFDDELGALPPAARLAAVQELVAPSPRGPRNRSPRAPPPSASPCAALARVLSCELMRDHDRWPAMAARLLDWASAELLLEAGGVLAPQPCCPRDGLRAAGIEVSMELLAFALPGLVAARELAWMQGIALLGQMVDDILDVENDLAAGRVTHGATGQWSAQTVAELYARLVTDTRALVQSAGETHAATLDLYERTVRGQLRHMAEVLIANP